MLGGGSVTGSSIVHKLTRAHGNAFTPVESVRIDVEGSSLVSRLIIVVDFLSILIGVLSQADELFIDVLCKRFIAILGAVERLVGRLLAEAKRTATRSINLIFFVIVVVAIIDLSSSRIHLLLVLSI